MQDAQYFRKHAALCLEIAQQMSDRQAAENLRTSAAHYFEMAAEIDHKAKLPAHRPSRGADRQPIQKEIRHG